MGQEQSAPLSPTGSAAKPLPITSPKTQGVRQKALVICGPAGVGKESLIKLLLERYPTVYGLVLSHTTRPLRPDGQDAGTYIHVSRSDFEAGMNDGQYLEHVTGPGDGHLYGTARRSVEDVLRSGKVAVLDVDVSGVRQLRAHGLGGMVVFVAPPSVEELAARLGRAAGSSSVSGTADSAQEALARAAELDLSCLTEPGLFDYLLVNTDLEATFQELVRIAQRVVKGLPPEPGMLPDKTLLEKLVANTHTTRRSSTGSPLSTKTSAQLPTSPPQVRGPAATTTSAVPTAGPAAAAAGGGGGGEGGDSAPAAAGVGSPAGVSDLHRALTGVTRAEVTAAAAGAALYDLHLQQHHLQQQQGRGSVGGSHPGSARAAGVAGVAGSGTAAGGGGGGVPPHTPLATPSSTPYTPASGYTPSTSTTAAAAAAAGGHHPPGAEGWRGRVALVTGASSGIGWATCEALGRAGLRVVAVARRRERLEALQAHMTSPAVGVAPVDFLPVVCDVSKEPEVAALPRIVVKRWPGAGIDVLVNNAGLSRNNASLFGGATSAWLEMLSTNVLGGAMVTREVLQDMQRRGTWGHVINLVGLSGHRIPDAAAGGTFFAATKHAVRCMTEGLRQEARARQVPLRVSAISPGLVDTEFFTVRAYGDTEAARQVTSSMRCLDAADVAAAILWCLAAPAHMEVNDIVIRPTQQVI